jgi:hypothetical protein
MKYNACAFVAALLASIVAIPEAGLPQDGPAFPPVTPVTKTWTIDPDPAARKGVRPGLAVRLRYVDSENITLLGAEEDPGKDFSRIKSQLWLEGWLNSSVKGYMELNSERKYYHHCGSCVDWGHEVIFENLYLEVLNIAGAPIAMRLGRQNLFYGDGLVICDGTPLDGSRTTYVNAALFSFAIPQWAFDIFLISDPEQDDYLPRLDDEDKQLVETDQCLMGIYFRNMPYGGAERGYTLEPYFIIKREKAANGLDRISTFGMRLVLPIANMEATGEATYQMGEHHENYAVEQEAQNISAFGGTLYLDASYERYWNLMLRAGYVYLEGDDPETHGKYEGWNPVLGRWPQWSELYIYTLIPEGGIAYWRNIKFPMIRAGIEPYPGLGLSASHLWMYANQPESRKRGNLYTVRLSYKIGRHVFGHVLYEHLSPGGYYNWYWRELGISGEPQAASFLRFEFSFAI